MIYIEGDGEETDELRGHTWILIAVADGSEAVQNYRVLLNKQIEKHKITQSQKLANDIIRFRVDLAENDYIPPPEEVDLCRGVPEKSHVDSMLAFGPLFRDRAGIKKDSEQTSRWFSLAAWQGVGSSTFYPS